MDIWIRNISPRMVDSERNAYGTNQKIQSHFGGTSVFEDRVKWSHSMSRLMLHLYELIVDVDESMDSESKEDDSRNPEPNAQYGQTSSGRTRPGRRQGWRRDQDTSSRPQESIGPNPRPTPFYRHLDNIISVYRSLHHPTTGGSNLDAPATPPTASAATAALLLYAPRTA
jgi:hypothetical protein